MQSVDFAEQVCNASGCVMNQQIFYKTYYKLLLLISGHFPPYTIIPHYTIIKCWSISTLYYYSDLYNYLECESRL